MTTIDWAVGVITLIFGVGLLTILVGLSLGTACLCRLAGRGVLWAAHRLRPTRAAVCPVCGGDFEHCRCGTPKSPTPRPYTGGAR